MRILNYSVGFLIAEALFLDGFIHLFLWIDQDYTGWLFIGFGVIQFAVLVIVWWWIERERNRGKRKARIEQETRRRSRVLALWTTGLVYALKLSFGIYHLVTKGWSWPVAGMLLVWSIGAIGAIYVLAAKKQRMECSQSASPDTTSVSSPAARPSRSFVP